MESDIVLHLLVIMVFIHAVTSANIAFYGGPGHGSHFTVAATLGEELAGRGHNVTAIISGEMPLLRTEGKYSKLFHFVSTNRKPTEGRLQEVIDFIAQAAVSGDFIGEISKNTDLIRERWLYECDDMIKDPDFINRLIESDLDLLIIDPGFGCPNLLPELLKIPVVFLLPTHFEEFLAHAVGSPINPATRPSYSSGAPMRMSFGQRLKNFLRVNVLPSFFKMRTRTTHEYRSLQNVSPHVSPTEVYSSAELILVNMDFAVEYPFPISPNVIPVGGITTRPAKPLEKSLEEFVQSSGNDGIIIFTMGSYATYMPENIIEGFATAFSRLPHKIVWKTTRDLPLRTDNSKIRALRWLPQNDLLAHSKTKLIIFQGGNNGFYEVVYHGVPCVVIPLLEDQYDIASRVTHHGMGVQLDFHSLDADKIEEAVRTVLGNKSYAENAAKISSRFRHDPIRPVEKAAFWVEYVIQHGGSHLRSVAGELTWFQYHSIDVIFLLAIVLAIMFIILFFILRAVFRLIRGFWLNYWRAKAQKTE